MRLLWLTHFVPYPATGHGALQRTHHLLRVAAERHEVHLVALSRPEHAAEWAEARAALGAWCASVAIIAAPGTAGRQGRVAAAARGALAGASYWERLFDAPAAHRALRALLGAHRFDAAHVDTVFLAPYLADLGDVPVVLVHHNVESDLLANRAVRVAENVVVSALDGERLRALAPNAPVTVVPNGVDVDFFRPAPGTAVRPRSLVWAGGMDWFPNADAIDWFADTLWPALSAQRPDRSATIVGRGAPASAVALAARDPRVRVTGFVDDVRPYVHGADVYLCPIRVGGGTRLKILDALAMGRPIVATSIGVEGLGLTPDVHYLDANDPDALVAAVTRLEDDPALGARLAAAGRAYVEAHFAWPSVGEALHAAYARAGGGPPAPGDRVVDGRPAA